MIESRLYELCQQSMKLSQEAFEMGAYETAYHLLAAALDSAKELHDPDILLDIASTAKGQLAWIDTYQSDNKYSTCNAEQHGQVSILKTLARRAKLEVQILQAQAERQFHW